MRFFKRETKEKRSIDDILTPKEVESGSAKESEYISNNEEGEIVAENTVEEGTKLEEKEEVKNNEKQKDIQVESPEEVSFNALTCFGWSDTKTPKWLIKCAHFWYGAMSFFWFIFGALTFAPIIFMHKKVNVIFKNKFKSFIASAVIYALFWVLLIVLFATRNGDKATEVVNTAKSAFCIQYIPFF